MRVREVIARRMREARRARGWSQGVLAEKVAPFMRGDWERRYVSAAENGARAFLAEDVVVLAYVLGKPPAWFLTPDAGDELTTKGGETIRGRDVLRLSAEYERDADTQLLIDTNAAQREVLERIKRDIEQHTFPTRSELAHEKIIGTVLHKVGHARVREAS